MKSYRVTGTKSIALIAACLLIILTAGVGAAYASTAVGDSEVQAGLDFCREYPVSLTYDGQPVTFEANECPPVIVTPKGESAGRTLIPARQFFEKTGAEVIWDNDNQAVTIKNTAYTIELVIGSDVALVNGERKVLDVPALIIDHDGDFFGSTMVPVRFVSEALNCEVEWINDTRTVAVGKPAETVISDNGGENGNTDVTGSAIAEGTTFVTGLGVHSASGGFPAYDMTSLPAAYGNAAGKTIVVDAGHGGKDSGSIGHEGKSDQIYEKDVNLATALKVAGYLEQAGFNVRTTRHDDTYVDKYVRASFANQLDADFFLCIHINSSETSAAKGSEVCYYNKDGESYVYGITSKVAAEALNSEVVAALGTQDRGVKSSPDLAVLNKTNMPAVIVEGAFISNESDFALLKQTDEFVDRYAYAISRAFIETFNEVYN